jgi:hypothetical protein
VGRLFDRLPLAVLERFPGVDKRPRPAAADAPTEILGEKRTSVQISGLVGMLTS